MRSRERVDRMIQEQIDARRRRPDPAREDILSLLMAARDEAGAPLRDDELRDELMTLLVAGHETTATALTWALYWIHLQPDIRERLLHEARAAGEGLDPAAIARLPYLQAVISETLRIHPVGMLTFPRVACRPVELDGHTLPPETIVMGSIHLAHRRPSVYPEPERFDPDRFLNRSYSPYEFLPFGGGSRRCIGMAFALYEMKLALHTILEGPALRLPQGLEVRPVRRGLTAGASPVRMELA
ncbi:MAG: cytochrome P450 [Synechococcaceae cyanobacterium]|nr:cytochrome P450 [Synechococcaceae cyanobacterium]